MIRPRTEDSASRLVRCLVIQDRLFEKLPRADWISLEQIARHPDVDQGAPRWVGDPLSHGGGLVGIVPDQRPGDVAAHSS